MLDKAGYFRNEKTLQLISLVCSINGKGKYFFNIDPWACTIEHFAAVIYVAVWSPSVFATGSFFHPSLIFASEVEHTRVELFIEL
jgi:hypothetical protein